MCSQEGRPGQGGTSKSAAERGLSDINGEVGRQCGTLSSEVDEGQSLQRIMVSRELEGNGGGGSLSSDLVKFSTCLDLMWVV